MRLAPSLTFDSVRFYYTLHLPKRLAAFEGVVINSTLAAESYLRSSIVFFSASIDITIVGKLFYTPFEVKLRDRFFRL
jgi:hypothetical protein